jgi:hypothetical protein
MGPIVLLSVFYVENKQLFFSTYSNKQEKAWKRLDAIANNNSYIKNFIAHTNLLAHSSNLSLCEGYQFGVS